ncbi:MAG TPA: acyltransferase, partial [Candidatus Sulfotelmatobacter sp.]|nr:acyltransferase [Candidatus Sulfotelmatobacter sp.]
MPRYEYRNLQPLPQAEKTFLEWIQKLDQEFSNRDVEHRSLLVRNTLHELYLGRPYAEPAPNAALAEQALVHGFDPRNATLEPEYYGDVDGQKYAERKPLIWFWIMFDRSPLGLNHWL